MQLSARHRADREFRRALRNAGIDESSLDLTAPALKNASRKSAAAANAAADGERAEEAAAGAASAADEQREPTVRSTSIEGGDAVLDGSTASRAPQMASRGTAVGGALEDSLDARRAQTPDSDRSDAQSTPRADAPARELDAV